MVLKPVNGNFIFFECPDLCMFYSGGSSPIPQIRQCLKNRFAFNRVSHNNTQTTIMYLPYNEYRLYFV